MITIVRFLIATLSTLILNSCNLEIGVDGNKNVITKTRTITNSFEKIELSRGINLFISSANNPKISVKADENLHHYIKTEIKDNILKIYTTENIRSYKANKVLVSVSSLSGLSASSGSDVQSTNTLNLKDLYLKTSSGSDTKLNINTTNLTCKATSGSDIELTGHTKNLTVHASSGSDVKAKNLRAEHVEATATSGADIYLYASKSLQTSSRSGGDINYIGNPKKVLIKNANNIDLK